MTSSMSGGRGPTGSLSGGGITGDKIPKGYRTAQTQNYTPEQMQLYQQSFNHVSPDSYTSRLAGGDQSLFNEIEAPALQQFAGLQGNLASRFSAGGGGRGSMSARHSSGFQNAASSQASDFAQQLQAQRQGLMRQATQDLMGMSHMLLGERPYDRQLVEKSKPWWQSALTGAASGIGQGIGQGFGESAGNKFFS